ncbi:hypothetical protein DHODJN_25690 [Methylorubrum extorquens]
MRSIYVYILSLLKRKTTIYMERITYTSSGHELAGFARSPTW